MMHRYHQFGRLKKCQKLIKLLFFNIYLSFYFNCYFKFAILFLDVESKNADMKKQIDGMGNR